MFQPTLFALEIVYVFDLEHAIETGVEGGGRGLRYVQGQGDEGRHGRFRLEVACLALDLRFDLAFKREALLVCG
jgi:hypothetical protein